MTSTCILHNARTCGKHKTIENYRLSNRIKIVYGYDWKSKSDNIVLIKEDIIDKIINELSDEFYMRFEFEILGGKDGSIYCDICRQIKQSDIAIFDLSTNNLNVVFELGIAIGTGAYVFMLRSAHSHRQPRNLSDLNGILEYRFTRLDGRLRFQSNFERSLKIKLKNVAQKRWDSLTK